MRGKIQIFAGRAAKTYADKVLTKLKQINEYTNKFVDLAGETKVRNFADGEIEVAVKNSVRRKDVYIIQNCARRNEFELSTHENKIELYHLIDALKRSHTESITVIEPYISCARSDRPTSRGSVGLWIHFETMTNLGANNFITLQLHSDKSKTIVNPKRAYLDNVPLTFLSQKHLLKNYIKTKEYYENEVNNNWVVCSVDAGGESLARNFSNMLGCQLIVGYKKRDYSKTNTVKKVSILTDQSIENKTVWIVDDMIDTGGSIYELVKTVKRYGVKNINILIMHPVLSGQGVQRLKDLYNEGFLNKLIVCDTLNISDSLLEQLPFIDVIETASLLAEVIYKTNIGESLNNYYQPIDPDMYLD